MENEEKEEQSAVLTNEDAEKNMVMGILAYILFFIPLLAARNSKFAMYHANQGLLLFLTALLVNIAGGIIPILGWFLILPLGNLLVLILAVIGIINAAQKQEKPLPLIGKYELIKD
ncbi:MAG TPA: hypothetical protein VHQ70_10070 [Syntrophomonadaceae bacterium]|nr:hypothetical protein [Syntrophomonadaceae bacterium]